MVYVQRGFCRDLCLVEPDHGLHRGTRSPRRARRAQLRLHVTPRLSRNAIWIWSVVRATSVYLPVLHKSRCAQSTVLGSPVLTELRQWLQLARRRLSRRERPSDKRGEQTQAERRHLEETT